MNGIASDSSTGKSAVDFQCEEDVAQLGGTVGQDGAVHVVRWFGKC